MGLMSFKKGVHPKYKKDATFNKSIEKIPTPKTIEIPMSQNLGAPAKPLKKKGDEVSIGEIIAESNGFISANIHSPVFGKVKKIEPKPLPGGRLSDVMIIDVDVEKTDNHNWEKKVPDFDNLTKDLVIETIANKGIVGMGGATFPTHIKFSPPEDKLVDTFVINGAECEPFLTCDHRLMVEKTIELLRAVEVIQHVFKFKKIVIGIEENKSDAITKFKELKAEIKHLPIEVVGLKVKYPQGAEKMLIKATTGRVVPSGKLPLEVGCIVSNIGTIYAIYEAFYFNKPLIERAITISGDTISNPKNIMAPIGTKLEDIIEFSDGMKEETEKIIFGGPMMGFSIPSIDYSVAKGTSGLLFFSEDLLTPEHENHCINCGSCVNACPMNLLPNKFAAMAKTKKFDEMKKHNLFDCMDCGSCTYVCPADIKIVGWIRYGKNYIKTKGI